MDETARAPKATMKSCRIEEWGMELY